MPTEIVLSKWMCEHCAQAFKTRFACLAHERATHTTALTLPQLLEQLFERMSNVNELIAAVHLYAEMRVEAVQRSTHPSATSCKRPLSDDMSPARGHENKRKFDQMSEEMHYSSSRWLNSEQENHSRTYKFDDRAATPIHSTLDEEQHNATDYDPLTQNPFFDQHEQTIFPSESMNDEHMPAIQSDVSNKLKVRYGSVNRTHSPTGVKQTKKKNNYGGVHVYKFDEHSQMYACSHC
jgi:hypothetical protein